jgi:uncharacterized protein YidB (DUF937 family)
LKRFGIPAALVAGGITAGSLFAPLGLASAQEDDGDGADTGADSTESSESSESSEEGERSRRGFGRHLRGLGGDKGETLSEALGLTTEEIREGFAAGQSIADMAEAEGVDLAEVEAALVAAATERIDAAVADGKIDEDRAAEMLDGLSDKVSEMVNADRSDLADRGHGRGDGHGRRGGVRGLFGGSSEELTELLGLSTDEIRAAMADGQSLADLAAEQGVDLDEVTAVLIAGIEEKIDQAVENGRIDADEAAEKLAAAEERVDEAVNVTADDIRERLEERRGERGERGRRGFGRHGGADTATDADSIEDSSF